MTSKHPNNIYPTMTQQQINRFKSYSNPDNIRMKDTKTGIWYQFDTPDEMLQKQMEIIAEEKEGEKS